MYSLPVDPVKVHCARSLNISTFLEIENRGGGKHPLVQDMSTTLNAKSQKNTASKAGWIGTPNKTSSYKMPEERNHHALLLCLGRRQLCIGGPTDQQTVSGSKSRQGST
jgi:hypothetical protein